MAKRPSMAGWYDPGLLAATGIRSVISGLFGHFADKREAIAAANAIQPTPADAEFDYSGRNLGEDFWFDYLADSGDGWNSTYAMARLAAEDSLDGGRLPRGELLILGGDQVYPTASKEEYRDRFIAAFDEAYAPGGVPHWPNEPGKRPDLYAIPGNHDWYDGLNSFFGLFCRRRVARPGLDLGVSRDGKVIGGRQTQQTRSYFAIALPNDWWVWGTDSQLEGFIDQPQIDYFQHAATYWMKPNSKVILCVADPAWAYVDPKDPDKKFESFSYLERLAGLARAPRPEQRPDGWATDPAGRWPEPDTPMGHQLKLVLTGDSHHYCRWHEDELNYIVCGGGGAFLHPTHHLRTKTFNSRFPKPGVDGRAGDYPRKFEIAETAGKKALFPDSATSWRLSWGNLGFAAMNTSFVLLLFCVYGLFNWILDFNAGIALGETFATALRVGSLGDAAWLYWTVLVPTSPWSALLVIISLIAYTRFADSPYSKGLGLAMGVGHALLQAAAVTLSTVAVLRLTHGLIADPRLDSILSVALATAGAAIASAIAFGLYLLFCIGFLGRHPNEGFSSMRIENYKSFLRLRIDKNGALTVFPIGLRKVPRDNGETLKNPPLDEHMIEPPIGVA
ncbi:MAG: hypothetical protein QOJ27_2158 [Sphingomonadales bacterium]|nr:hypothetical protein [Sphingomonadales bacterium]